MGNKIDLGEKRQVNTEEGEKLATQLEVHFMETSAKVGINVKNLFKSLAQQLPGVAADPTSTRQVEEPQPQKQGF